jgi:prephenate dehydrogenase
MMAADTHDEAVALVSHMPQVVASIVARRLPGAVAGALSLAGQGLRDVTRIAGSDPGLWATILVGNAEPVAGYLRAVRADLDEAIEALDAAAAGELGRGLAALHRLMAGGNEGVAAIPGKHGGARNDFDVVTVLVPDSPGELGRLFTAMGEIGVNLEDVEIEHAGGKPVGLTAISVVRGAGGRLAEGLAARGWQILGEGMTMALTVAIDGPSGSGKSSVARAVASRVGLAYLDTGAMYRAAALWALQRGLDLHDGEAVLACVRDLPLVVEVDPDNPAVFLDGQDVGVAIRDSAVSTVVSLVATTLPARALLVERQRTIVRAEREAGGFSAGRGIVAEGRDITTVVAPEAEVRVLLTASEDARLARRALEIHGEAGREAIAATRDQVVRRDRDDSAAATFLEAADGVAVVNSSHLTLAETIQAVLDLVEAVR